MFESHVTVEMDKSDFFAICEKINVKAVVIEEDTGSDACVQMMTAKFHKTEDSDIAMSEMHQIASNFPNIIRRKLERIVGKRSFSMDCKYEELHSKFVVPVDKSKEFVDRVLSLGGHTALNVLRQGFRFVTSRNYFDHQKLIDVLKNEFELLGTIREFVLFDDNPLLDSNWRCFECPLKVMS